MIWQKEENTPAFIGLFKILLEKRVLVEHFSQIYSFNQYFFSSNKIEHFFFLFCHALVVAKTLHHQFRVRSPCTDDVVSLPPQGHGKNTTSSVPGEISMY